MGANNAPPLVREEALRRIIVDGDAKLLVETASQLGRSLKEAGLSSSQIRTIFGEVRELEMRWHRDATEEEVQECQWRLLMLRPKLAYQEGREAHRADRDARGTGVRDLRLVLDPALVMVEGDRKRFGRFVDFFEAILAYHRAAGGR